MASPALSRRVEKVVGYPPLCDLTAPQWRELHEALLEARDFEDLPGKWQAAILKAEQNRPKLRLDRYGHLMPGAEGEAAELLDAYLTRAEGHGA